MVSLNLAHPVFAGSGGGGEVHHPTILGLGLLEGLGPVLNLGLVRVRVGVNVRVKVRVRARVRVSKLGGELLHQRPVVQDVI